MRNLILFALLLSFGMNLSAQDYIGLNAGFGLGRLERNPSPEINPYTNFSFGVTYNKELSNRFAVRITPTYLRYGEFGTYESGDNIIFLALEGPAYLNSITTPIEMRWLVANNKFIASINGGFGYTFLIDGKIDQKLYTNDLITNELRITVFEGDIDLKDANITRHSIFFNAGLDVGYKINDNFIMGLNLTMLQGITNLNVEKDKQFGTTLSLQVAKILN